MQRFQLNGRSNTHDLKGVDHLSSTFMHSCFDYLSYYYTPSASADVLTFVTFGILNSTAYLKYRLLVGLDSSLPAISKNGEAQLAPRTTIYGQITIIPNFRSWDSSRVVKLFDYWKDCSHPSSIISDHFQFAYKPKRSTFDAPNYSVHFIIQSLNNSMLFVRRPFL